MVQFAKSDNLIKRSLHGRRSDPVPDTRHAKDLLPKHRLVRAVAPGRHRADSGVDGVRERRGPDGVAGAAGTAEAPGPGPGGLGGPHRCGPGGGHPRPEHHRGAQHRAQRHGVERGRRGGYLRPRAPFGPGASLFPGSAPGCGGQGSGDLPSGREGSRARAVRRGGRSPHAPDLSQPRPVLLRVAHACARAGGDGPPARAGSMCAGISSRSCGPGRSHTTP